jgi:hypothetical protein
MSVFFPKTYISSNSPVNLFPLRPEVVYKKSDEETIRVLPGTIIDPKANEEFVILDKPAFFTLMPGEGIYFEVKLNVDNQKQVTTVIADLRDESKEQVTTEKKYVRKETYTGVRSISEINLIKANKEEIEIKEKQGGLDNPNPAYSLLYEYPEDDATNNYGERVSPLSRFEFRNEMVIVSFNNQKYIYTNISGPGVGVGIDDIIFAKESADTSYPTKKETDQPCSILITFAA